MNIHKEDLNKKDLNKKAVGVGIIFMAWLGIPILLISMVVTITLMGGPVDSDTPYIDYKPCGWYIDSYSGYHYSTTKIIFYKTDDINLKRVRIYTPGPFGMDFDRKCTVSNQRIFEIK